VNPGPPPVSFESRAMINKIQQIKYRPKLRRIHLQRFLIGRFVHELEKVTLDELLVIYDNLLFIQDLAEKNPQFGNKFGKTLEVLTKILKQSNLNNTSPKKIGILLSKKFKAELSGFYTPLRNMKETARKLERAYRIKIIPRPGEHLPNQPPPKNFIGVGYRDHGSRRDRAKDGSPTWQEVAMSLRIFEVKLT